MFLPGISPGGNLLVCPCEFLEISSLLGSHPHFVHHSRLTEPCARCRAWDTRFHSSDTSGSPVWLLLTTRDQAAPEDGFWQKGLWQVGYHYWGDAVGDMMHVKGTTSSR